MFAFILKALLKLVDIEVALKGDDLSIAIKLGTVPVFSYTWDFLQDGIQATISKNGSSLAAEVKTFTSLAADRKAS